MTYCVAVVDGGASGSRYALYGNDGVVIASHTAGPASLTLGVESTWHTIETSLKLMLAEHMGATTEQLPQRLVMGLAGSLQSEHRTRFLQAIPATTSASLYTDGYAQLIGASGGQPGVCLAAGTGTVVHWLDEKNVPHMAGGWGYPIGDDGSGAWLGMQLINDYLWHRDGERLVDDSAIKVFQAVDSTLGGSTSEIQRWTTSKESTRPASLVPLLADFANSGNVYAKSLVVRGIEQVSRLVSLAPANLPLYVTGGLSTLYASGLQEKFGDRWQTPKGDSLSGLYLLSRTAAR